ncbi:Protein kinase domain-containing protein [Aphelenchoides fujianensis]|nr:Protein kinase domain-containing protein [Aphelenchoides fujianensis]
MAVPPAPARIALGDKVKDTWLVKKKLGEGSCGVVYLVQSLKHAGPEGRAALKVEPFMKCKDDEILKMEVFVLRKMQQSRHVCRLLMAGKEKNYRQASMCSFNHSCCSFMVISLLGKELSELRRRFPERKMPPASTLKVGLQTLQAIQDLHAVGFVHRDVKPTNFACGAVNKHLVHMFDFGLARQILTSLDGKGRLREPRAKVSFRGTVRYCSLNVHNYKEQGRHDDLWSWLAKHKEEERAPEKERDEKAEIDKMEDTDTHRDVDESVESAASDGHSATKGFAKEDTLEVASDVQK